MGDLKENGIPPRECEDCGAVVPRNSPIGFCPYCVALSTLQTEPGSFAAQPWEFRPPTPEELDALIPSVKIASLFGRGGMGAVYKGRQLALDRDVAIKLLPKELTTVSTDFEGRFRREARAMAKLNHPNIVTVYDFGKTAEGHCYFVMEYIEGVDLHAAVNLAPLPPDEAASAIADALCALGYAHSHGVVHRDIKPANLLRSRNGRVKVADFGIARLDNDVGGFMTMTGQMVGTPAFAAPEQREKGLPPVDHRADLYALGKTLYFLIAGTIPESDSPKLSTFAGGDKRWDRLFERSTASAPEDRFADALEMGAELDGIRRIRPLKTRCLLNLAAITCAASVALLLSGSPLATKLDHTIHDHWAAKRSAIEISPDLEIVAITNDCLSKFGGWPWTRDRHGALLDALGANGSAVAFDILFAEAGQRDAELGAALARSHNSVVAVSFLDIAQSEKTPGVWQAGDLIPPIPEFAKSAAAIGHTSIDPDSDGLLRRVPPLIVHDGITYPTLGLALAMRMLGVAADGMSVDPGYVTLRLQDRHTLRIPLDHQGRMVINYPAALDAFPAQRFSDLVPGDSQPDEPSAKAHLVGMWAEGMSDDHATPIGASTPGVFVHAAIANSILTENFMRDAAIEWRLLLPTIAFGILFAALFHRRVTISCIAALGATLVLYAIGRLMFGSGILMPLTGSMIAILVGLVSGLALKPLSLRNTSN